ncbi:RRM domain-containing protein [Plasmodiophora brassicae]
MNRIKEIERINKVEVEAGVSDAGSWHAQYKSSAYVIASGLDYRLSEGDLLVVFSQCGEIVDLNLIRDKDTGKSRGFAFIAYEDQRSTVLAVDNFNGAKVAGRVICVDHVAQYRRPKTSLKAGEEGVNETDEDYDTRRRRIWDYTADRRVVLPTTSEEPADVSRELVDEDARMKRIEAIRQKRRLRQEQEAKEAARSAKS